MSGIQRARFGDFKTSSGAEIFKHPDGSITIEMEVDYGDSEIGWHTTYGTINMTPEQVKLFAAFLTGPVPQSVR